MNQGAKFFLDFLGKTARFWVKIPKIGSYYLLLAVMGFAAANLLPRHLPFAVLPTENDMYSLVMLFGFEDQNVGDSPLGFRVFGSPTTSLI